MWPGLHFGIGRSYRKAGVHEYLKRWLLAHGTLPDGVHDVIWNQGDNCMQIDFTRLRNDWLTRWRKGISTTTASLPSPDRLLVARHARRSE